MTKSCVFCGRKPDPKTKEHVVPRWLIELTGDPKRKVNLGFIKDFESGFKLREFSFDRFTFPACGSCNQKYAALENVVKSVITKILDSLLINIEELNLLLDWFDKVRVGLWLGMRQLDKNYVGVDPNFYIDTRVSQYDRMLIVEKSNAVKPKLNIGGVDNVSFALTPSAFVLIINEFYFTNVSFMYLFHRRLGFPYPQEMYVQQGDERVEARMCHGHQRIMSPLLRKSIKEHGLVLFQPMFRRGLIEGPAEIYNTPYVRSHSIDCDKGIGNIFLQENRGLIEYKRGDQLLLKPSHVQDDELLFLKSAIHICEWQNWLTTLLPSTEKLPYNEKRYVRERFKTGVRINNKLIQYHKSLLERVISKRDFND